MDLGAIPNTGPVSCTLEVRNVGRGWLEITGLSTSCGCTTAEIARQRLAPGEATDLVVTFDPQAHGGLTGPFLRQVYIRSNDPETPEAVLTLRGTVVAAVGTHQDALPQPAVLFPHSLENAVTVYYNRACADCLEYVQETVLPLLRERGYPEPVYRDYINEPANRAELLARSDALGIPPGLQSHLTVFIGDRIILEGHVPEHVVADLLAAPPDAFDRIGLGLMQAILFTGEHHLMARIGSWLVIVLGLINVQDYFFPQLPIHLRIPTIAHGTIQDWLKRATYPAAAVGGFLVGLCTFPCSGGIYVAIVGLLTARTTYWQGVGYLGLYNLMFVAPLLLILAGVGNRRVLHRIRLVEQSSRRWVRLATGLGMIAVGAVILVWFV